MFSRKKFVPEIKQFAQALATCELRDIQAILLFGSMARGDATPESDIDILVLMESPDSTVREELRTLAYEVMRSSNFAHIIALHFLPATYFENLGKNHYSFYETIQEEGQTLWKAA